MHPKMQAKAMISQHPLDLSDFGFYEEQKEDLVVSSSHFKTCKHIDVLIKTIPSIHKFDKDIKFEIYGGGIEYYYMSGSLEKRKIRYKIGENWIWEEALGSGMEYKGRVSQEILKDAYKRAKLVTDLSTWKQQGGMEGLNYVVLECIKYGGIPVIRRDNILKPMWEDKNFIIVEEEESSFFGLTTLEQNLTQQILSGIKNFDEQEFDIIRSKNRDILFEYYDCEVVSRKILERLK